jgi:MFS transporter, DHA2 family, multidrug resistance protein
MVVRRPAAARPLAILSASAGTVLLTMDASIVSVALPAIARKLPIAPSSSALIVVVHNLVPAMTLLPFAGVGELLGLRRLYRLGLVASMRGGCLRPAANNLALLVAARAAGLWHIRRTQRVHRSGALDLQ